MFGSIAYIFRISIKQGDCASKEEHSEQSYLCVHCLSLISLSSFISLYLTRNSILMHSKKRSTLAVLMALTLSAIIGVSTALALFTNGSFEAGDFSGWTKTTFLNTGLTGSSPFTGSSIVRGAGGTDTSVIVGGPSVQPLSQNDPILGTALQYPRFGNYAARVGSTTPNQNANSLAQASIIANSDIDSTDNQIHIRFAYAPILQNPNHAENSQPYFYIAVRNVTRNTLLYENFNFSGQSGVPWQTYNDPNYGVVQYTNWQLVDIAPGSANIAVNDNIQIEVIAAGCSLGGHFGYVYVDAFGSDIPGLTTTASGPAQVDAGQDLTYTFNYSNGSSNPVDNVILSETLPAQTTFVSVSDTTNCTYNNGVVTCNFGTLAGGASGNVQVTVHVAIGATGTINNGNYSIAGTNSPALLGPLVKTPVIAAPVADLSITKTDGQSTALTGLPLNYAIVVQNNGPTAVTGATVADAMPSALTNVTWTCAVANGATCTSSGSGDINDTVDLPVGATATYSVHGVVAQGTTGNLINTATVAAPTNINDSTPANNSATDSDVTQTDTTPPSPPVIGTPAATNDTTPVIFGTAEANSTVIVGIDLTGDSVADVFYTTTANGSGNWSVDTETASPTSGTFPVGGLVDGTYTLSATATDASNNTSQAATASLQIDTSVPTVNVSSSSVTPTRIPVFSGTAEPNSTVTLVIDLGNNTTVTYIVTTDSNGIWSIDANTSPSTGSLPNGGLADGSYTISVTAQDAAGNTSATENLTLLVDRTAPNAPAIGSANLTDDRTPVFFGTAEPNSVVTLYVDLGNGSVLVYQVPVDSSGGWSVDTGTVASSGAPMPVGGLLDGAYSVSAVANDAYMNQSSAATQTLTIDGTAPTPPTITSDPATSDTTPIIAGTAEPNSVVTVVIALGNGVNVSYTVTASTGGTWSIDTGTAVPTSGTFPASGLIDGTYNVSATAKDITNNTSAPASQELTIDTTLPTVTFTSPELTNDTTPSISGFAEPGSTVTLVIDLDNTSVTYTTIASSPSGAWTINLETAVPTSGTFPATGLTDGNYMLSATASDSAGNTGPATNQVLVVDTGLPTVSITSAASTKYHKPLITGTAEPNSTVRVVIELGDGTSVTYEIKADSNGAWSIDTNVDEAISGVFPTNGLPTGSYIVTATAIDAAGNTSLSDSQLLTIEGVAINAPQITSQIQTRDTTPLITGQADPGTTVTVELDLNGDGITDVTYVVPVDATGIWRVDTGSDVPVSGVYPANGMPIGSDIGVTATARDDFGNVSSSTKVTLSFRYLIILSLMYKS